MNEVPIRKIIEAVQRNATEDDYRAGMIEAYLDGRDEVCVLELWKYALGNEFTKPSRKESNDIVLIMQGFPAWKRQEKPKRFSEHGVQRYWKRKWK